MDESQSNIQLRNHDDSGERRAKERPVVQGCYNILLADDSRTVIFALKTVLEQAGYSITVASNGEQAIDMAHQTQPDLIFMDVNMPGMTGYQATRLLNLDESTSHIPIVIISGSEQKAEEIWCKRLGAKDVLLKPIERRPLFSCIESLLH